MPARALIQLNESCNLRCAHCSQSAPHESVPSPLLERDAVLALLAKLRKDGLQAVRFTGGDPFLYADLENVTCAAASMGLRVSLITNGQTLADWPEQRIADLGAAEIIISFYSPDDAGHDQRCGVGGSFERAWQAVDRIRRAEVMPRINLLLPRSESATLAAFLIRAAAAGITSIKILQVFAQGRAAGWASSERLTGDDFAASISAIRSQKAVSSSLNVSINLFSDQIKTAASLGLSLPRDLGCRMGLLDEWTVSGRGEVLPCCLYLDRRRRPLLSISDEETFHQWKEWDRNRSVQWATNGVVTTAESLSWCPVIDHPGMTNPFICPLTFVEI